MDRTSPLPKKVATVERWPLGEFWLYTQRPTRVKATGKISEPTKLSETRELKKKMKEIKREREKVGKTQKQTWYMFRDRGILGGSVICRESDDITKTKFVKLWDR